MESQDIMLMSRKQLFSPQTFSLLLSVFQALTAISCSQFPTLLKSARSFRKRHPISTDISSREHTYFNNDFLNKKHIDGKQNFLIFKVFHLVNHTPNNPLGEMLLEIQKYQIQADIGVNQSTARKIKKYQRKWECVIKEDPTKCIYK